MGEDGSRSSARAAHATSSTRRAFVLGTASGTLLGSMFGTLPATLSCAPRHAVPAAASASAAGYPVEPIPGSTHFPPDPTGHLVVLEFWASWCSPCRRSFGYLDQLYRRYQQNGLLMLAISVDDDRNAAQAFVARVRPHFPTGFDGTGQMQRFFSVQSLPTTLLIDRKGDVLFRAEGFDLRHFRRLDAYLQTHLRA